MLEPSNFSDKYQVRKLTSSDIKQVYSLCKENPLFSVLPPFCHRAVHIKRHDGSSKRKKPGG